MFGLGPSELIVLVVILVLLFGAKKVPELARGIGESIKILRNSLSEKKDKTDKKS